MAAFLAEHPRSTLDQASEELGIPRATLARAISRLRASGIVSREGSNRSGVWVVRLLP